MIEKTTLSSAVIEEIRSRILVGTWKPGDKLPPLRDLAKEFGVSLSPTREALKVLEAAGVLRIRPGDGVYVEDNLPETFETRMSSNFLWDGTSILDVLDIRKVLELETAYRAAKNAKSSHILQLQELYERMQLAVDDPNRFAEADLEFHLVVADASGNQLFRRILETLSDLLREQVKRDPLVEQALRSHKDILEAIIAKDATGAREAMEKHLDEIWRFQLRG